MTRIGLGKRGLALLTLAVAGAVATISPVGRADHPDEVVLPGHSAHGDTFDEGPRRSAPDMAGTGDVHIPVTTRSAAAQKFIDQGLGQLHGFWYLEAERSFRQAAAIDPDCPMAYWGMAMANKTNAKRAKAFIAEAVERLPTAKLTDLERAWIDAVADYYEVGKTTEKATGKDAAKAASDATSTKAAADSKATAGGIAANAKVADSKSEPEDQSGAGSKTDAGADSKPEPDAAKSDARADASKDAKSDAKSDAKPKPDPKADTRRKKAFLDRLAAMRKQFPGDIEIKAFSVLYIWEFKQTADYKTADKLLDEIFAANPRHPAHHYRIHLCDGKRAKEALVSAAMCGPVAPGIAHMWHMPGHIYSSLQRYGDAAWQQEASARTDHAYMIRDRVMPYEIHNYAHNNEWLIRDLLLVGRVRDGIDLAKNMIDLPRHPKYGASSNRGSGAEYGFTRLIDALSQHQMWQEYLQLCDTPYLPADEGDRDYQIRRLRFKGVAHAALGQNDKAEACIAELTKLRTKPTPATRPATQPSTQPAAVATADRKSDRKGDRKADRAAGSKADATTKPVATTRPAADPATKPTAVAGAATRPAGPTRGRPPADPNRAIDQAIANINGELALGKKDYAKAIKLLTTAAVRQDQLSQVHLAAGDTAKAIEVAKKAADAAKGQTAPLANYVNILFAAGKTDDARKQFDKLQELASAADLSVEPYKSVGKAARAFGIEKDDWRAPYVAAKDLGERPPLDQLGPFRWHPWSAPAWSAPAADGSAINLESFKGKPVVVIFYLGHGCLHCTQQLHAFAPMTKQYHDAGISLVAVSTDTRDSLNKAWEGAKLEADGEFPFPLVSDASLRIFRQYLCYDDFENAPLHGTFLIDGEGKVRWQDISAEPFMDGAFLLKEAKRLLSAG